MQRAQDKREFLAACEDFADRSLAARVFDGRHPRRHRPAAPLPEPAARRHPHLPRRPRPERARAVGDDPLLLPGDDEAFAVLGIRGTARDLHLRAQVPVRLPVRQEARVVRAARRGAPADHGRATSRPAAVIRRSRSTPPTRSASTTRSSSSRSRPTSRESSSTWSRSCAAPSRAPTPCATRRSSPAWRCPWRGAGRARRGGDGTLEPSLRSVSDPLPFPLHGPRTNITNEWRVLCFASGRAGQSASSCHRRLRPGWVLRRRAPAKEAKTSGSRSTCSTACRRRSGSCARASRPTTQDQVGDPRL